MITNAIFILGGIFINLIVYFLTGLSWLVPPFIATTFAYFFSGFGYLASLVPIQSWLLDFSYFLKFLLVWYGLKLVLKGLGMIPWFRPFDTKMSEHVVDLRQSGSGNVLDLRKRRGKNIQRNTRDVL